MRNILTNEHNGITINRVEQKIIAKPVVTAKNNNSFIVHLHSVFVLTLYYLLKLIYLLSILCF